MHSIELLSPARDLQCGLEAIRHGADAVYIGGPQFRARAAAGNSVADIAERNATSSEISGSTIFAETQLTSRSVIG